LLFLHPTHLQWLQELRSW